MALYHLFGQCVPISSFNLIEIIMAQTYLTFTDAAKLINLTYTGRENIGRRFTVDELAMMADQNYYMQMKKHTAHHRGQKTEFFVAPTPLFD